MDFLEECEGKFTWLRLYIASTCAHIGIVIIGIFRASMEPFWDLKIIIIEYHTHVSSEYFASSMLSPLISMAGLTSSVLLAYVIPWINKASLVLYNNIASMHAVCVPQLIWSLEAALRCRARLCDRSIETCHYRGQESVSDSWGAGIDVDFNCTHTMLTTFTTWIIATMQLPEIW